MSKQENENKVERKRYSLNVEPSLFDADGKIRFMTSIEFCRAVNEYFSAAFADYNGCKFVMDNGPASISLYFNHVKEQDDQVYACGRLSGKSLGNSIIDKTRTRDQKLKDGDRYILTDDGKDIIVPLLIPRMYNNGKPDLKRIATDIYDNAGYGYYGNMANAVQLTQVVGIDPRKICEIIWGKTNDDKTETYDYSIEVKADLNRQMMSMPGVSNPNYVLVITQANSTHINETCAKLGINTMSSSIVRK